MSDVDFLDTNVLVYAYDAGSRRKQAIAQNFLIDAVAGKYAISTQVLAEFSTVFLHKINPPRKADRVLAMLDVLHPIRAIPIDASTTRRAVEAHSAYGVHFYDGLIIAAAEKGGCRRIWSEDLNAGQSYFGISIENPFR